ncbi:hypothetical protein GQ55_3G485900 [Panicum hallii var. hallii]|uniref:Uncharacterized protein n=1 Tax=Panicum hallii var. hallii TaxID=1504633 RepID=A0A2T7EJT1_9POAL|nr:hypothetical protein GQ55_3G485900 [Panicum hallii var. hallii]
MQEGDADRRLPLPVPRPRRRAPLQLPVSSGSRPCRRIISSVVGSALGHVASAITDGWLWGAGSAMAHGAMDAVLGPRKFEIEHTTAAHLQAAVAAAPGGPCDIHAQAFQDVLHDGSDISRCQFYVDVLNDRRRRGQVAIVEASG